MNNLQNYFSALYKSFYDGQFYHNVVHKTKGAGILFMLFLVTITLIPPFIVNYYNAKEKYIDWYYSEGVALINQVPVMLLNNGKVSSPEVQPYVINCGESSKPCFILDTTGVYNSLEDVDTKMLITETMIFFRKSEHEVRSYDLSQIGSGTSGAEMGTSDGMALTPELIQSLTDQIIPYIPVIGLVLYCFILLGIFIFKVILALFVSILSFIFTTILGTEVEFSQRMRVAAIAIVPVTMLDMVLSTIDMSSIGNLLSLAIILLYVFFIFKASLNDEKYGGIENNAI